MIWHWILAARPKTLIAGFSPIAIGTLLAYSHGRFHLPSMLMALLGAISVQIGTNFCNDYCDFFQGADTAERKGPTRAVQAGLITPRAMLLATIVMFTVTCFASLILYLRSGWPLLLIGGLSVLFGVLYTAGRYSLAYQGLGEPFVLVFFGPVAVAGTYYVQALQLSWSVIIAGLGPGLLATALLVVNNLRDVDEDRQANKRTLVVRFGSMFGRCEYAICILMTTCVPLLYALLESSWAASLAALILVPGLFVTRLVFKRSGIELAPCLGMTAGLLLLYSVWFCVGVAIA